MQINGEFDVKLQPRDALQKGKKGIQMGRFSIHKTYHGELNGSSVGEMLSVTTTTNGSAGYVAIEQFSGTLGDKKGSFVLQHYGIMHAGDNRLVLEVVPGSGSDDLTGLTGTMAIDIIDGKHLYKFTYQHGDG